MVREYIPESGDIIFIDINPTIEHEQGGYRPAVVISNNIFNKYTKMAMILPITTNLKKFPTHHIIKSSKKIDVQFYANILKVLTTMLEKQNLLKKWKSEILIKLWKLLNLV